MIRSTVLLLTALAVAIADGASAQSGGVYRVTVSGTIEMGLAPYIERSIREAEAAGARAIVLELETPGGRIDAAQRIVKAITNTSIPVYAYVNTHAWSAGAMIALATDSIFMVPGSSIGAATPVTGDGQKGSEKIVSAMRSEFRALAERRGLDPRIAEAMVDEEIEVEGVVESGKLLTLTVGEAEDLGWAAGVVTDFDDLLGRVGITSAQVITTNANWAEQLVRFLSHPIVSPILLSLGTLGLIFEIKSPSFGIAGTVGLLSFGAFFGSHLLIGLAGWEEVILLGAGLIALGIEVLVIPGFGIAGIVSILCIGAAIFLSLVGGLPTWDDFARASAILAGAVMMVGVGIAAILKFLPSAPRIGGVFLDAATGRSVGFVSAPARDELVGAQGITETDLHPAGIALVDGERLDVISEGGFIPKGTRVRVTSSEGYRHVVTAIDAGSAA
jgi:membrane-bound serine protease (ClpP class)